MAIWQQSDKAEYLEGLQTDPVFRMLLSVLAYQSNEFDSEIEQIKVDILDEFAQMMSVGEAGKALPATIAVETGLTGKIPYMDLDSSDVFAIGDGKVSFPFIPLLHNRVVNAHVKDFTRLDGRRWLLRLDVGEGVTSLNGMTFAIPNGNYNGLHATLCSSGLELPLISPWDCADMPMSRAFSLDTLMYNRNQAVNTGNARCSMAPFNTYTGMDLFVRQDMRIYVIDDTGETEPYSTLEIMLEFESVAENFNLDKGDLHINVVPLVNAQVNSTELSTDRPIERIAGSGGGENGRQFLHLLRPSADQLYGNMSLMVRRVAADRFNHGRLSKLLNNLIARYSSDYYAFMEIGSNTSDKVIRNLRQELNELSQKVTKDNGRSFEGVYVMLSRNANQTLLDAKGEALRVSLNVEYLTTDAARTNVLAGKALTLKVPEGLDDTLTRAVTELQPAFDEVFDAQAVETARRYYMTTEDRLVTRSDIKLFCYTQLQAQYGLVRNMIKDIRVTHELLDIGSYHTYEIVVNIQIVDNVFTQRAFADKMVKVETILARMAQVRTTDIYPIRVHMTLTK